MNKKILMKIFPFLIILIILFSCEKEITTDDPSYITYYVKIELKGGEIMAIPKGTPFVEPGWIAKEANTDISNKVTVTGEVDHNKLGLYNITYTAFNKDGFPSNVTRKVIVYDPDAPNINLAGKYKSTVVRTNNNETYENLTVRIDSLAPGFFYITDFLGGFYDQGRKYGPNYAMFGYFSLNSDFTLSLIESFIPGWGESLKGLEGSYNVLNGTLDFKAYYVNFVFVVSLTK